MTGPACEEGWTRLWYRTEQHHVKTLGHSAWFSTERLGFGHFSESFHVADRERVTDSRASARSGPFQVVGLGHGDTFFKLWPRNALPDREEQRSLTVVGERLAKEKFERFD